ncbi:hypothetical protein Acsp03_55120 [Actinomadura sp. NBRC 104412]|nr:hypothetical protein Acsp03_55120 [Actinomadura sp. NBRC 104412]
MTLPARPWRVRRDRSCASWCHKAAAEQAPNRPETLARKGIRRLYRAVGEAWEGAQKGTERHPAARNFYLSKGKGMGDMAKMVQSCVYSTPGLGRTLTW